MCDGGSKIKKWLVLMISIRWIDESTKSLTANNYWVIQKITPQVTHIYVPLFVVSLYWSTLRFMSEILESISWHPQKALRSSLQFAPKKPTSKELLDIPTGRINNLDKMYRKFWCSQKTLKVTQKSSCLTKPCPILWYTM